MSTTEVIKNLKNGVSFCHLCGIQFKTKTNTAHVNGKKHRDALIKNKTKISNGEGRNLSPSLGNLKRPLPKQSIEEIETETKRKKIEVGDKDDLKSNVEFGKHAHQSVNDIPANVLKSIPVGFFDDISMETRVKPTVEKQKEISHELDQFYKEMEELDTKKEDEKDQAAETSAIRSDIEIIDEQIERWKNVNELEKQKELLVKKKIHTKFDQQPNFDPVKDQDDDANFDFETINWRNKEF